MDVTMKKEEAMVALPQKQKHTNHLLKIAYISGFCINTLAIIQAPSGGLPPSCRSHGV